MNVLEVCSHVAVLLFKVEMAVKIGLTKTTSTSKACDISEGVEYMRDKSFFV